MLPVCAQGVWVVAYVEFGTDLICRRCPKQLFVGIWTCEYCLPMIGKTQRCETGLASFHACSCLWKRGKKLSWELEQITFLPWDEAQWGLRLRQSTHWQMYRADTYGCVRSTKWHNFCPALWDTDGIVWYHKVALVKEFLEQLCLRYEALWLCCLCVSI